MWIGLQLPLNSGALITDYALDQQFVTKMSLLKPAEVDEHVVDVWMAWDW